MADLLVPRSDVGEFRRRYKWMALVAFLAFGVIFARLFQLQVLDREAYATIAHENIVRRVTLPTTRGVIRDSQGKVLASSRAAYNLYVVPGRAMPTARPLRHDRPALDEQDNTWPHIADVLRLNPDERRAFDARIRAACVTDDDKSPCWRPILVREDLSRDLVAELRQHQGELTGAEVTSAPVRYYPFKNTASHAIGYVAEIDAQTLARYRPPNYEEMSPRERANVNPLGYEPGDIVGMTGVEHAWESYLRGQRGWEKRVVDARGRFRSDPDAQRLLDEPVRQDPIPGRDLRMTLDIELEQSIEKAMHGQTSGAVVAVDVRTGRLLALYSKPDFDLNDVSGGGGRERMREAFNKLYSDPLRPIVDKTMTGSFQPGSTFKPFSALAALEDRVLDPEQRERCDGYLAFGRRTFKCTHVHGKVNMHEAIAESCNVYFWKVAESAGMDRIARMASEFGLGAKTGIGVNPEAPGRIPTRAWYALHYRGQFRVGFTLNATIGEGATTVTPLQLALGYAAIANGGTLYSPQLVRAVETSDGAVVQDFPPRVRHKVNVKPENLAFVNDALYGVVNEPKGTAYPVRDPTLDVAGKTGTAETGYIAEKSTDPKVAAFLSRNHAWFAAYSPAKAPEIVVVVLLEHGGAGPTQAAPAAMEIVRDYERISAARAGRPLPPKPPASKSVANKTTSTPPAPAAAAVHGGAP